MQEAVKTDNIYMNDDCIDMNEFSSLVENSFMSSKLTPKKIRKFDLKPGLRNTDASGVNAGLTSIGRAIGYIKDPDYRPVDGKLIYRGISIDDIVKDMMSSDKNNGYEETAYLLLSGKMPNDLSLQHFSTTLAKLRRPPIDLSSIVSMEDVKDHMAALHTQVSLMGLTTPYRSDPFGLLMESLELIACLPCFVAGNYRLMKNAKMGEGSVSEPYNGMIPPRMDLTSSENFFYMLEGEVPSQDRAKILDLLMVLHADHGGGNNSTFSTRTVSSSRANTYMAIDAGIGSLSGHLHGGANEKVMDMMNNIKKNISDWYDVDEIRNYLMGIMSDKGENGKIYGIGHAVYTLSDPRARILEKVGREIAKKDGRIEEFNLLLKVGEIGSEILNTMSIERGCEKKYCPNVDFYSWFVYDAIGIPKELFTPAFAMSRIAGWCTHRMEEIQNGRIIRPGYVSTVEKEAYVPMVERK